MVLPGTEVHHRGTEEAPLHACLDLQRRVCDHEFLEACNISAVVVSSAEGAGEGAVHCLLLHEVVQLVEAALPVLRGGQALDLLDLGTAGEFTRGPSDVRPLAEE